MKIKDGRSLRKRTTADRILVFFPVLALVILFVTISYDYELDERIVMVRYMLFALSGIFAFILPYISFPDPESRLCQLANFSPGELLGKYVARHRVVWGTGLLLITATILIDSREITSDLSGRILLLVYGVLLLGGIYLYAAGRYLKIGKDSQQWQEGQRGMEVRKKFAEMAKYPVDPGSIPSLISTILISLLGMMTVVAGALARGMLGAGAETAVAAGLFVYGWYRYRSTRMEADCLFYQANAFFSEFFGVATGPGADREPLKVEQLWWIPGRWKADGWGLMLQMDRKLPSGRFVIIGHLFLWVLAYQAMGTSVMFAMWAVFATLHHGLLLLTINPVIAPRWWLRQLGRPAHWVMARVWIQMRWLLPMMLSMMIMKWFFALFDWSHLGMVFIIYLAGAFVVSLIISSRHEKQWINV